MATLLAPKMQTQEPPLPHEVGCEVFHGLDLHENVMFQCKQQIVVATMRHFRASTPENGFVSL